MRKNSTQTSKSDSLLSVKVGITSGDPAGVGPEIILAALGSGKLPREFDYHVYRRDRRVCAWKAGTRFRGACGSRIGRGGFIGKDRRNSGSRHGTGFQESDARCRLRLSWSDGIFAERCGVTDFAMCLTGGKISVALVTAHVPLARVPGLLRPAEIVRGWTPFRRFPRPPGDRSSPHRGGRFEPSRRRERRSGFRGNPDHRPGRGVASSFPVRHGGGFGSAFARTPCFTARQRARFDGVLCMYHDQGLIPLKLHAFDQE